MEIMSAIIDAFDEARLFTDASYAEILQFQEALQASLNTPSSSTQTCQICFDEKPKSAMFELESCRHSFCTLCISKHVEYKLKDNVIHISCPDGGCSSAIQPRAVRPHVAAEVVDRWEEAVAESAIAAWERVRCPYDGCGEISVNDGGEDVRESECPWCGRWMCVKCKVTWHEGMDCREFQRVNGVEKEKKKLKVLARENKWKKCPICEVFVEKIGGCIHVTCRCKFEFCYVCGEKWKETHWKTCLEE